MSTLASRRASRLAKTVLGACALTLLALSGASAQYYQPPGYYGGPPPGYYGGQPRGYYEEGYSRPRRVPMGNICVTSRGECAYGRPLPLGTRCKCHVPGFGPKHGEIQ